MGLTVLYITALILGGLMFALHAVFPALIFTVMAAWIYGRALVARQEQELKQLWPW